MDDVNNIFDMILKEESKVSLVAIEKDNRSRDEHISVPLKVNEQSDNRFQSNIVIEVYVDGLQDGEEGVVDNKSQLISYDINIEYRSWGIKDIDVVLKGSIDFNVGIFDLDGNQKGTIPVKIDFEVQEYDIEWQKGSGYAPDVLEVQIDRKGNVKNITASFFYTDPSR